MKGMENDGSRTPRNWKLKIYGAENERANAMSPFGSRLSAIGFGGGAAIFVVIESGAHIFLETGVPNEEENEQ